MKKALFLTAVCVIISGSIFAQWTNNTNPYTFDNVGIGLSTPTEKLSISSSYGYSGCNYIGNTALKIRWSHPNIGPACPGGYLGQIPSIIDVVGINQWGTSSYLFMNHNGLLGIGTNTPVTKLDVAGDLQVLASVDGNLVNLINSRNQSSINNTALIAGYSVGQSNNPYIFKAIGKIGSNAAVNRFVIRNDGYVGIGIDEPKTALSIKGCLLIDANASFNGTLVNANGDASNVIRFGGVNHGEAIGSQKTGVGNLHGLNFYTSFVPRMSITNGGAVTIGNVNTPAGYKLYVEDGILTEQVKVAIKTTNDWSDFVFDKDYQLPTLAQVETYIKENKHLPNVPSAAEVVHGGVNLGKMDATLLQKIEELTLYTIELQKQMTALQQKIITLENKK